jgi:uncharacterized protein (DUF1697 family)
MGSQGGKFVALLRGINVGGKNIILKDQLRQAFEDMGFTGVRTYIQSGNILFRSVDGDIDAHTRKIESVLSARFSYNARTVVLSEEHFRSIVEEAPDGWGVDDEFRHRILFVLGDATPEEIMGPFDPPDKEVESITLGRQVIYSSVSKTHLARSVLRKLAATPHYQQVTVRNHNPVKRINMLFDEI